MTISPDTALRLRAELRTRSGFRYRTERDEQRIAEITGLLARADAARALPDAAADLKARADRAGWTTDVRWGTSRETGLPYVVLTFQQLRDARGPGHGPRRIVLIWHSAPRAGRYYLSGGYAELGGDTRRVDNARTAVALITTYAL